MKKDIRYKHMLSKHAPLPARKRGEERLEKRDENTVIGLTPYPMLCRPFWA